MAALASSVTARSSRLVPSISRRHAGLCTKHVDNSVGKTIGPASPQAWVGLARRFGKNCHGCNRRLYATLSYKAIQRMRNRSARLRACHDGIATTPWKENDMTSSADDSFGDRHPADRDRLRQLDTASAQHRDRCGGWRGGGRSADRRAGRHAGRRGAGRPGRQRGDALIAAGRKGSGPLRSAFFSCACGLLQIETAPCERSRPSIAGTSSGRPNRKPWTSSQA